MQVNDRHIDLSVICTAYNHENYIAKTLDSLIGQITQFSFEVIVHDDASTDGTAAIIRGYAERYPSIVKAILQKENQYSKHVSPVEISLGSAVGRYIALCEGDDFWSDTSKIEKQLAYMEANPDCTFCFTNGFTFDSSTGTKLGACLPGTWHESLHFKDCTHDCGVPEIVYIPCAPTASFVFPSNVFRKVIEDKRQYPRDAFLGDYYLQLAATSYGYAHFIDDSTVGYRVNNPLSLTGGWKQNGASWCEQAKKTLTLLSTFNDMTGHRYDEAIQECSVQYEFSIALFNLDKQLRQKKYRAFAKMSPEISMPKYYLAAYLPKSFKLYRRAKAAFGRFANATSAR